MKKLFTLSAIAGLALSVVAISQPKKQTANTLKVSAQESTIKWTAKKVTGEHWGNVKFSDGTVTVDGKNLTGGTFNMDMTSIDCQDLQGEYNGKLVGHLKSDDFFAVEKFKTATLKIKSLTAIAGAKAGDKTHNVTADLTIKGMTHPVSFPAQIIVSKTGVIANADFDVDRTLYDIKYGSGKFFEGLGDKAINDNFNIKVRVIAK
ncbi:MAG: YceI family protein [Bacteroidetes bacterium]|nr:MAG: YceI family protein [Bacteroidota bacterium]